MEYILLGQGSRQRNGYIISLRNFLSRRKSRTNNDSAKVRVLITILGSLRYTTATATATKTSLK